MLNEKGRNAGHGRSITSDQPDRQEHERLMWSQQRQIEPTRRKQQVKTATTRVVPSRLETCGLGIIT